MQEVQPKFRQLLFTKLHDIAHSLVPLDTDFRIYGYDNPKSHADGVQSYYFFWFFFLLWEL